MGHHIKAGLLRSVHYFVACIGTGAEATPVHVPRKAKFCIGLVKVWSMSVNQLTSYNVLYFLYIVNVCRLLGGL